MRCPRCRTRIVRKSGDGKLKCRTSMLAMSKGRVEVVCRKCGADVAIALELGDELRKALEEPTRRLVVKPQGQNT